MGIEDKIEKKQRKMLKNFATGKVNKAFRQRLEMIQLWLKKKRESL